MSLAPYILIPAGTYGGNQLSQTQIDNVDSIPYLQANINSATPSNISNTIVKRDSGGSFSGSVISATGVNSSLISTNAIESLGSILSFGNNSTTQSINIGCGTGIQNINLGTTSGTTTINLGGIGDSVIVQGDLVTVNTTNLAVQDKNIILNMSGAVASGFGAGIQVMEGGNTGAGYIQVSSDRSAWVMKPPAGGLISLNQSLLTSDSTTFGGLTVKGSSNQIKVYPAIDNNETSMVFNSLTTGGTGWIVGQNIFGIGSAIFGIAGGAAGVVMQANPTNGFITIPKTIVFPGAEIRKRISFFDDGDPTSQTDHRFNGFGKGNFTQLYQTKTTSEDHVFYAATSATTSNELFRIKGNNAVSCPGSFTVGSVATAGNVSCGSLSLAGGLTPLSVYTELDFTTTFTLGSYTSSSVTLKFTRIGRTVTVYVPAPATLSGTATASTYFSNSTLPAGWLPNPLGVFPLHVTNNGVREIGSFVIASNSVIGISANASGNFSGTGAMNWFPCGFTYTV